MTFGTPGFANPHPNGDPPSPKITVRVYDYAQVPKWVLTDAKKIAADIFREAGIETSWLDCPVSPASHPKNPVCLKPLDPTVPVLRILSRSMAERVPGPRDRFGFALLSKKQVFPYVANVFFHRIHDLANGRVTFWPTLLGHIMAHEMGHLLLGQGNHSRKGIMAVEWSEKDLQRATRGSLRFNSRQAEKIQAQVLRRLPDQTDGS